MIRIGQWSGRPIRWFQMFFSPLRRNAEVVIPRGGVEFEGRDDVVVGGEHQALEKCPARDAVVSRDALQREVGGGADPGIEARSPSP